LVPGTCSQSASVVERYTGVIAVDDVFVVIERDWRRPVPGNVYLRIPRGHGKDGRGDEHNCLNDPPEPDCRMHIILYYCSTTAHRSFARGLNNIQHSNRSM